MFVQPQQSAPHLRPKYQALLQLLRSADALWDASRVFFQTWDLSPSQFNVLNLLYESEEGMSQSDLSRELIVHRSNVTGLVDRLQKSGLVERREVPGDRRAYRVCLSAEGRRLIREILPQYYATSEQLWPNLEDRRIAQLTTDLRQVALDSKRIASQSNSEQKGTLCKPALKPRRPSVPSVQLEKGPRRQ